MRTVAILVSILCGFFLRVSAQEKRNQTWISQKLVVRDSFFYYQLSLWQAWDTKKFRFSELSYHPTRKWTETRYEGNWQQDSKKRVSMQGKLCKRYAADELGNRWILTAVFDCEHLQFHSKEQEFTIEITPGFHLSKNLLLYLPKNKKKNQILAVAIQEKSGKWLAWGDRLYRIKKNALVSSQENKGFSLKEVWETVLLLETTGKQLKEGELLFIRNPPDSGF
ncbi:MAG: hypothetical protein AAF518_02080 [Spirochaetota bacterium]